VKIYYRTKVVWGKPAGPSHVWLSDDTACGRWKRVSGKDSYRRSGEPLGSICDRCRQACTRVGLKLPADKSA